MPNLHVDTVALLARIAFLLGAITDALALIPMLSPRIGAAMFGGDLSRNRAEYQYAMGIGASLMAGWTILLLWAAVSPLDRRDILLLTVFPVVAGIAFASAVAVRKGIVLARRMVPLWAHLAILSGFYLLVYVVSIPFAT